MPPDAAVSGGEKIRAQIETQPFWQEARILAAYAALPGEPDLRPLTWTNRRTVLLPRVEGDKLAFYTVNNAAQLHPGAFGVLEPDPAHCPAAFADDARIVLVPGLAFTAEGGRLGRGRGYYDRLLAGLPSKILRVGICFARQIVPSLPAEAHDQPVDIVLTAPD